MRLHPAVTFEEALAWLIAQARAEGNLEDESELASNLKVFAETMVFISTFELPEDLEPSFP